MWWEVNLDNLDLGGGEEIANFAPGLLAHISTILQTHTHTSVAERPQLVRSAIFFTEIWFFVGVEKIL